MRKNLYALLFAVSGILFAVIVIYAKKPGSKYPVFLERKGVLAQSAEWLSTKQTMQGLLANLEANPKDYKSELSLAELYIEEARITGNHAYYDQAALQLLNDVTTNDPKNFQALCDQATVLLSQHHFSDGLLAAKQALPLAPYSTSVYGLLVDANVELGHYDEAVKMADKMVSLRPDLRSYSRVSYLREIYGDLPGAISAMNMAVKAGYPGLEQTEWSRMILAHLYESKGDLDSAEIQCKFALAERPDYAFAVAGLGRIEKARGNYKQAIAYFEKAKNTITEFSFADELTDLYRLNNEQTKAKQSAEEVIAMLSPNANADENTIGHGHYADKELAYAFLKTAQYDSALAHAKIEYDRRPDNIDICETMAWVYYKKGAYAEANKYIDKALRTNSSNPTLLCRAGLIKTKTGDSAKGSMLITKALQQNPFLEPGLKTEASHYAGATASL